MIRKIERDQLAAEIASLEAMLQSLPANDPVGRLGFESRLRELRARLETLTSDEERRAAVALYFGGEPVIGSRGIRADFGSTMIATYQDLVAKVWATLQGGTLPLRGQIRDRDAAQLHITSLVHGSVGFLLEEIDERGEPLFPTPVKEATHKVTEYMEQFTAEDDQPFNRMVEEINPRIFASLREFFRCVHKEHAVFRVVEGETDRTFDERAIERAYTRAETTEIAEEEITVEGELIGVVPYARRFEFRTLPRDELISGKVAESFSQAYLERIHRERIVGQKWQAVLQKRETRKPGRLVESFILLEIKELHPPDESKTD
ncbi:MAG: hypothetical protein KatS3mg082_3146 [Nitrospiraceae bacterium]|nr:MAG: hypothetical protein KatS3mg082_3146 [Nitrospiraceae bacterium]